MMVPTAKREADRRAYVNARLIDPAQDLDTNGGVLIEDGWILASGPRVTGTGQSAGDALLAIHRSYLDALERPLRERVVHGLAHITGGGVPGNLPRILPEGLGATLCRSAWKVPAIFETLQRGGGVALEEMDRVFNMGLGMIAVVDRAKAAVVIDAAAEHGIEAWIVGSVEPGHGVRYSA